MYTLFPERRYFMFCFKWTRFLGTDHEKVLSPSAYFSSLPHLRTDRLLLRPLQRKDAKDIFSYASDPEVARYVLWEPHQSISDTRSYISYMLSLYRHGYPGSWAVVHQKTGSVIGTIGFMWYSDANRSAEIGYSFSRQYWNQGYATESLRAVIKSSFSSLPLNRLEAQHDLRNPASGRVMKKCGMRKEGILRQRIRNNSVYIDTALYAVLRCDLEASSIL